MSNKNIDQQKTTSSKTASAKLDKMWCFGSAQGKEEIGAKTTYSLKYQQYLIGLMSLFGSQDNISLECLPYALLMDSNRLFP